MENYQKFPFIHTRSDSSRIPAFSHFLTNTPIRFSNSKHHLRMWYGALSPHLCWELCTDLVPVSLVASCSALGPCCYWKYIMETWMKQNHYIQVMTPFIVGDRNSTKTSWRKPNKTKRERRREGKGREGKGNGGKEHVLFHIMTKPSGWLHPCWNLPLSRDPRQDQVRGPV